jgi:two-component system sensor histidine kinase/response regulator
MPSAVEFVGVWTLLRRHAGAFRAGLLTVVASMACIGLLWFGIMHSLRTERAAAEAAGRNNTGNLARVFADNTARAVRQVDDTLLYVRDSYVHDPNGFDLSVWGRNRQFQAGLMFQVSLIGPNGHLTGSSLGTPQESVDLSDREHFRVHVEGDGAGLFISKPVLGRISGRWSVQLSRRVTMQDGGFGGVVVISVDPAYLADFYGTMDLGLDGSIVLVGLDGVVRARAVGDTAVHLGQTMVHADWLRGDKVAGHAIWQSSLDGIERLLAYRRVPELPLVVLVTQATAQVFAEYENNRHDYFLAGGLLSVMILLACATVVSHQVISHQARVALRRSAAEQQATLENMSQGIMMIDADGTVAVLNHRAIDLLGLPAHFAQGRPRFQSILAWQLSQREFGDEGSLVREIVRQNECDGARVQTPPIYERQRPDGQWLEVRSTAMPDGRMVRTFTDITARKANELALAAARDAAEAATRARSEFLAVMSHEMRTPLNGVIGMATLLSDSGLRDDQAAFASTLDASARHLLQLIDDVLDFSRLDAGKVQLEEVDFELAATVHAVAQMLAPRAGEKGLKLACCVDPALPVTVHGDAGRLRQILLNLAGNAVKFTEQGGLAITVRRLDGAAEGQVRVGFRVVDTGVGIHTNAQSTLFDEFVQADSSISRRFGGTGLGLAISRRLVEAMGGAIGFDSAPGAGTTFYFDVRLRGGSGETSAPLAGQRLLVIDDVVVTRETVMMQLSGYGAAVAGAATLQEALDAVCSVGPGRPFDAVLCDCGAGAAAWLDHLRATMGLGTKLVLVGDLAAQSSAADAVSSDLRLPRPVTLAALASVLGLAPVAGVDAAPVVPQTERVMASGVLDLGLRILLAEDNAVNQRVAAAMLARVGCRVDIVENGQAALEALDRVGYDLVLMDLMMPEMDGLTAVRALRALPPPVGELPVLMLTAATSVDDVAACRAAGANAFLAKPIDFEQLKEVLGRYARASGRPRMAEDAMADAVTGPAFWVASGERPPPRHVSGVAVSG